MLRLAAMLRPAALLLLAVAAPAMAQTDDYSDITPDAMLAQAWSEALYGAEGVARALDDVAADTAGASAETVGEAGRARALAAVASAASATSVALSMQFSIALADPAERPSILAAIEEDALGLHLLLVVVAENVHPPRPDPTLMSVQNEDGSPAVDPEFTPETWAERAAVIREVVGRLRGATAALGITAP